MISHLDFREKNGYTKVNVQFYPVGNVEQSPFFLVIYLGEETNEHYAGEADLNTIAQQIFNASGPSGSNKEYLYKLAAAMRTLVPCHEDPHLFSLEEAVRKLESNLT